MEAVIEEVPYDSWSDLPEEIACEIITRITDLRSLLNYMQSSQTFYRLARLCTRMIDSPVKVEVPLSYFAGFQNLQLIGDKILVTITAEELSLLSTLPSLRAATLLYIDSPETRVVDSYASLRSILRALDLGRKIPQMNFHIILHPGYSSLFLIIQGNRFGILGADRLEAARVINEIYPQLQYLELPGLGSSLATYNRDFMNLLRDGDFGLVDPSQPPSEKNPPFSYDLHRLADSGALPRTLPFDLILLYAAHNGLVKDGTIYLDDLMKRYIQPAIVEHNRRFPVPLPLDRIIFSTRPNVVTDPISGLFKLLSPRTFSTFDLPSSSIPLGDLTTIDQQVRNAYRHYQSRLPFYRTDGTFVQPQ